MNNNRIFSGRPLIIIILSLSVLLLFASCTRETTITPTTPATTSVVESTTTTSTNPEQYRNTDTTSTPTSTFTTTTQTTASTTTTITSNIPITTTELESLTLFSVSSGDVMVMRTGTSNWIEAKPGMTLGSGDIVKSGDSSSAEITFFDGSIIELQADTQIEIAELGKTNAGSTTIRIKQEVGTTFSRIQKLADPASRYEVETRAAVAAVRGSSMTVTVSDDGETVVTNNEGDIRVIAQGVEIIIPEGMHSTVTAGEAPGEPQPPVPTTTTPTTTTTPVYTPPPAPAYIARISTGVAADRPEASVGDTINYTYHISNTGNIQLQNVSVSDNLTGAPIYQGGDNIPLNYLNPGETWIYTASHVVTESDQSPLVNTAHFSTRLSSGVEITAEDQAQVTIIPSLVTVTISSPTDGATIDTHTITVTGAISDSTITNATITINGNSHPISVSAGNFSTSENVNNGVNVITITVNYGAEQIASDTVTIYVDTATYGMRFELTWDTYGTDLDSHLIRPGSDFVDVPGDCYYNNTNPDWGLAEITSDNPSLDQDDTNGYGPENITLQDPFEEGTYQYIVHYYDDHSHGPTTASVTIWINDVQVAQYSRLMNEYDLWDCARVEWPSGNIIVPGPAIGLEKTANVTMAHVGDTITYNFEVTNQGNTLLSTISLSDNQTSVISFTGGDDNSDEILGLTETWAFSANYMVQADDPDVLTNTATVSGTDVPGHTVNDSGNFSVIILRPGIDITKSANVTQAYVSDNITYTYEISNTGNTALSNITITDDIIGAITNMTGGDTNENGLLDINETWVFTADYMVNEEDPDLLVNTVAVTGKDALMLTVGAEDTATITVLRPQ